MSNKRNLSISFLILPLLWFIFSCDKIEPPFTTINETINNPDTVDTTSGAIRKVLLEDFTGHKCGYCPQAATIAQQLIAINGERLVVMSLHVGETFATPETPSGAPFGSFLEDFRTTVGDEIEAFYNVDDQGLPKGMVNRRDPSGDLVPDPIEQYDNCVLPRADWEAAVQAVIDLPADIDISITNTYDTASRIVSASVETEFLNNLSGTYNVAVYLTEDSIISWQKDQTANPQYIEDYVQRHVLRGSLNGTWGELVDPAPVVNTLYTKSYNLMLDNTWDENHCSIVAFVYETTSKEVVQVEEAHVK
ncbi:MAG TPA: Omp28 family outer membrane lipoprotein [Flavobacteriales bacterium]|nr:Omp28 family outer membrane lipoprotein [Flavobacteriales bacterium]HIN39440.1 Omp28 family outer membrane lipoprotein [Flavobacteriales bacterium]